MSIRLYTRCSRCECNYPRERMQEMGGVWYCVDALETDAAKSECSRRLKERKDAQPAEDITTAIHRALANGEGAP